MKITRENAMPASTLKCAKDAAQTGMKADHPARQSMLKPRLFTPFTLRGLELPNRIVVSPMNQYSGDARGRATDWHLMHLGHLAISGAGLLFTEAIAVEPEGRISPTDIGLWNDEQMEVMRRIVDFCRTYGTAKLGAQLCHSGRKGSVSVAWEGLKPIPVERGGWRIWSPSSIPHAGRLAPAVLDHAGIRRVIKAFADNAMHADRIGFDAIEIHSAHGYLLHSFLSPFANQRSDEYGGTPAKRMRMVLEVFQAVRDAVAPRKPVGVRISATDWAEGGWGIDDSVELAAKLKALGCDYITASSGGVTDEQKLNVYPGYQVPFAERIRRETGIATMAVGLITEPKHAEEILDSGRADLIALARGMLLDPRWPWRAALEFGVPFSFPKQYERAHPAMRFGDFLNPKLESGGTPE